ncbi:ATP-grasp domain-containing protein [bacterium]|nr:ATP-grasp domain-containing protein [bacterium]
MRKKLIVLLGANEVLCDRAKLLDIDYILILNNKTKYPKLKIIDPKTIYVSDYSSPNTLKKLKKINENQKIEHVLSITEKGLYPTAVLNEKLDIVSTSIKSVECIKNKHLMRKKLTEHGFNNVDYCIIHSFNDLIRFIHGKNYPFILKPTEGSGSKDIYKIDCLEDIHQLNKKIFESDLIVEQYIDGNEYSIETFSFNGNHRIFSVTKKALAKNEYDGEFIEIGHQLPTKLSVSNKYLQEYISKFLDIMELKDGLAHTEIIIKDKTIYIIETHNRNGGDNIANLVRLSTGHDLYDYAIKWPLKLMEIPSESIKSLRGAAIRYFNIPPNKILKSISGLTKYKFEPNVVEININLKPGDTTPIVRSSHDRVGYVICTGNTAQSAMNKCKELISKITFEYQD